MVACTGGFDILVYVNSSARESVFSRIIFSKREISLSPQKNLDFIFFFPWKKKMKMVTTLFEVSLP